MLIVVYQWYDLRRELKEGNMLASREKQLEDDIDDLAQQY